MALTFSAPASAAGPEVPDPYFVFFSGDGCHSGLLEVEVFDRGSREWRPHPAHWRILADTCHREDAGGLLNEVRVRCYDRNDPGRNGPWKVGFRLEELRREADCERPTVRAQKPPDPRITLEEPAAGETIVNLTQRMRFAGRVDLDHDVVVLLDRTLFAEGDRRERAISALARWLEALSPGLGPLRVAVQPFRSGQLSVDDVRNPRHEAREAQIPYATDAATLRLALADVVLGREPPAPSLLSALGRLAHALTRPGVPPRRRTLLIVADTHTEVPFGPAAGAHPTYRRQLLADFETLSTAAGGVRLHAVLVGRPEAQLGEFVDDLRLQLGEAGEHGVVRIVDDGQWLGANARLESPHMAELLSDTRGRASLAGALAEIGTVSLAGLRAVNTTNGVLAEEIEFGRDGRFRGSVALEVGANRLRIEAMLSDLRSLEAEFEHAFDNSQIREHYLEAERARMKAYRERMGIVTIEAEEK